MTTILTVVIAIWGLTVIAFMALMVYRAHLTQYETDQLFLNETVPTHVHQENDDIIRRLNTIGPICKGVGGAAIVMTLAVIGVWAMNLYATAKL
jgi:hypothetical protein